MKDQPWDLNQTWPVGRKWCRFTNSPLQFRGGPTRKFGAQKNIKFWIIFFAISALDTAYLRNETSYQQTKMLMSIYNVSLKLDLLSVTFDPEMAKIRSVIVTHPSAAITLQLATCMVFFCFCFRAVH